MGERNDKFNYKSCGNQDNDDDDNNIENHNNNIYFNMIRETLGLLTVLYICWIFVTSTCVQAQFEIKNSDF